MQLWSLINTVRWKHYEWEVMFREFCEVRSVRASCGCGCVFCFLFAPGRNVLSCLGSYNLYMNTLLGLS